MKTTPEPTKGSKKRRPVTGRRSRSLPTSFRFAPAHFKNGFAVGSITCAAMFLGFIERIQFFRSHCPEGWDNGGGRVPDFGFEFRVQGLCGGGERPREPGQVAEGRRLARTLAPPSATNPSIPTRNPGPKPGTAAKAENIPSPTSVQKITLRLHVRNRKDNFDSLPAPGLLHPECLRVGQPVAQGRAGPRGRARHQGAGRARRIAP